MQKPPPKKKFLRKKKARLRPGQKPGQPAPALVTAPPPKPKPLMDFTDKDPWGYRFNTPMWKLDRTVDMLKRDPLDRERERINAVLLREFRLEAKDMAEGFNAEAIPWGSFHEDPAALPTTILQLRGLRGPAPKSSPRRAFAEDLRREALESRTGLLGIAQVHFLASKHCLMTTLKCKVPVLAFPLTLDIEEATLKEKYKAQYVLQIDRVFYPVQKLPQTNRFALPDFVVDAFRLLDAGAESRVRSGDKKVLATLTTASKPDRDTPLHWHLERGNLSAIEVKELKTGEATLYCDGVETGQIDKDFTLRFDGQCERAPLIGLLIAYIDFAAQRKQGVLARARAAATKQETPPNDS